MYSTWRNTGIIYLGSSLLGKYQAELRQYKARIEQFIKQAIIQKYQIIINLQNCNFLFYNSKTKSTNNTNNYRCVHIKIQSMIILIPILF